MSAELDSNETGRSQTVDRRLSEVYRRQIAVGLSLKYVIELHANNESYGHLTEAINILTTRLLSTSVSGSYIFASIKTDGSSSLSPLSRSSLATTSRIHSLRQLIVSVQQRRPKRRTSMMCIYAAEMQLGNGRIRLRRSAYIAELRQQRWCYS